MKLIVNNYHIKNIPKKFECIPDISDHIEDLESKRLSRTERLYLNVQLMRINMVDFIMDLRSQKEIAHIVADAEPVCAIEVQTTKSKYYILKLSNGIEVRCPLELFRNSPNKDRIKRLY